MAYAMTPSHILWYFADPMCSWCWGFSPVIAAIKDTYDARLKVALILGGLRPGTTEAMTADLRADILHHWHEVQRRTGQPFKIEGAMPEGFVYDTEPASRAVIAVSDLCPEATFAYFASVQHAFYAEQADVTRADTLAALARAQAISAAQFLQRFESAETVRKLHAHFQKTRQAGVRGFPTLLRQDTAGMELLAGGYRPFAELKPDIDAWLAAAPT